MTGQQPEIQWYIAREGKQHGPLSEAEMRTFVAHGHLKPTDLIWRPGFSDWRTAPAVFPFNSPEETSQPLAIGQPEPTTTGHPEPREPAHVPPPGEGRSFEPNRIRVAKASPEGEPRRLGRVLGIVLVVLLLAGAGTWYFTQQGSVPGIGPTEIADGANKAATSVSETTTAAIEAVETPQATPPAPGASTIPPEVIAQSAKELDAQFQQIGLWNLVKREFPDWYGERLNEVAKLSAEKRPQDAITKHMAEAIVALRRKHADKALAASTEKLKKVATAFLANLNSLSAQSPRACFGFISKGETAPVVLKIWPSPEKGAAVHALLGAMKISELGEAALDLLLLRRLRQRIELAVRDDLRRHRRAEAILCRMEPGKLTLTEIGSHDFTSRWFLIRPCPQGRPRPMMPEKRIGTQSLR